MRIAVVQLAYNDEESFEARVDRVAGLIAAQRGHDLVVLPELWGATGFDYTRWAGAAQPLDGPWARAMADAARAACVVLHAGSFVERLTEPGADGNDLANTSLLYAADGQLLATYRKIHRFGFGAGEPKLMEAGDEVVVAGIPLSSGGSVGTGLSTCYDLRFPELYWRQVLEGAELFVIPAAWPAARVGHWALLGRARAVENQAVVVQCNTAGSHGGYDMGGRSQVVSASGEVLVEAASDEHGRAVERVLSVEVDLAATAAYRTEFPVLSDRRL